MCLHNLVSLEESDTNSSDSLICREDERDPDEGLPQRNPELVCWRGRTAPDAGCCSVRPPRWKLHLADKTLVSGRGCLDYQHYSRAAVGEGEQRYLGLHLPAERVWHEEGWHALPQWIRWSFQIWNLCSASHPNPCCCTQLDYTTALWHPPCAPALLWACSVAQRTGMAPGATSAWVLAPALPWCCGPVLLLTYSTRAWQLQHCMRWPSWRGLQKALSKTSPHCFYSQVSILPGSIDLPSVSGTCEKGKLPEQLTDKTQHRTCYEHMKR